MTNLVEATDLIYKEWLAYMASVSSTDLTLFGNEDSVAGVSPDERELPWYRVTFRESAGGRANLNGVVGTRKYERLGFLAVQCFTLANTGEKLAKTMAENARAYFEDRRASATDDIIYLNAEIRPQQADGKWFGVLLEVAVEVTDRK